MKVFLITNVPAPYRVKQFDLIGKTLGNRFFVCYTQSHFSNTHMKWNKPQLEHQYKYLDENSKECIPLFIRLFILLKRNDPEIVITSGFNILMITAFIYSKIFRKKHVVFTDTWLYPVSQLSKIHRIVRKVVIKRSAGFICVGKKGKEYLECFGANTNKIFSSRLSDDIEINRKDEFKRKYHLIFSGQLIDRKQPLFFVEVVIEVAKWFEGLQILILGTGPLEEIMLKKLDENKINYRYEGFVSPEITKDYYKQAKILLFPTKNDPWGMVANDAMSVGLPVITTPYAGSADDLVIDGFNGFILDLDVKTWAAITLKLLQDTKLYSEFSENALSKIKEFSVEKAATDFAEALSEITKN